jgi:hypothetical protein
VLNRLIAKLITTVRFDFIGHNQARQQLEMQDQELSERRGVCIVHQASGLCVYPICVGVSEKFKLIAK